ncbi:exonuclease SbcC, partial [Escherichia coli EC1735]
MAFSHSAD